MFTPDRKALKGYLIKDNSRGLNIQIFLNELLSPAGMQKLTKIIATIGPASDSVETIKELHESGMDIARLNFSHGDYEYFSKIIDRIREVDENICIMLDTKGPEIRTNPFDGEGMQLKKGDEIAIEESTENSSDVIRINYPVGEIADGTIVYLDDGLISAKVNNGEIKVLNDGFLGNKKSVTFKEHDAKLPFLTEKDKEDIRFGISKGLDFVAASYVRNAEDIRELRSILESAESRMGIIAKIEHCNSVRNIGEIIELADGIMVARGDLGVEMDLEKVPSIQRKITKECNLIGKPVIVATQMLESMTHSPRPTRAEVSDVSHAILQGADAIMLSGETAQGKHPVEAVQTMARIAGVYDTKIQNVFHEPLGEMDHDNLNEITLFITKAAYLASKTINVSAILTPTESGYTARKVARFRPKCPILAITRDKTVSRQLNLVWGVYPVFEPTEYSNVESYVNDLVVMGRDMNFLKKGEMFVMTAGHKLHEAGTTNLLEIYKVDDILDRINSVNYL